MKPRMLLGNVRAYIARDLDNGPNLAFIAVTRLIPVLIGSATLCACSGSRTLSAPSDIAGSSSAGTTSPTTTAGGGISYVGINVLVSGLDSGSSLQYSLNGSTPSSGVISANGDETVPGEVTGLKVGSSYS